MMDPLLIYASPRALRSIWKMCQRDGSCLLWLGISSSAEGFIPTFSSACIIFQAVRIDWSFADRFLALTTLNQSGGPIKLSLETANFDKGFPFLFPVVSISHAEESW
jgi:hypothetical protein